MGRLYQPLLFLLARCTRNELIRQIEWLKAENEMLRKRVGKKRIFLNHEEKQRLMKLGRAIGSGLKHGHWQRARGVLTQPSSVMGASCIADTLGRPMSVRSQRPSVDS